MSQNVSQNSSFVHIRTLELLSLHKFKLIALRKTVGTFLIKFIVNLKIVQVINTKRFKCKHIIL